MIGPRNARMARPAGRSSVGRVGIQGLGGLTMIRAQPGQIRRRGMIVATVLLGFSAVAVESRADVIAFTGNVANDFPASVDTEVINGNPSSVAQSPYILENGWTSGFLVNTIRLTYDKASDTLFVGDQDY